MRHQTLFGLIALGALGACGGKVQREERAYCAGGRFDGDATGALTAISVKKLTEAIDRGAQVRVEVTFLAGDKDSANTELWFEPVSVYVLRSVVYAESAALKWPPSRYSWPIDSTSVDRISFRASSEGKLSSVQGEAPNKTESAPTSWCID